MALCYGGHAVHERHASRFCHVPVFHRFISGHRCLQTLCAFSFCVGRYYSRATCLKILVCPDVSRISSLQDRGGYSRNRKRVSWTCFIYRLEHQRQFGKEGQSLCPAQNLCVLSYCLERHRPCPMVDERSGMPQDLVCRDASPIF